MRLLIAGALIVVFVGSVAAQEKSAPSANASGSVTNTFQFSPQPLSNYPGADAGSTFDRSLMTSPGDDKCYFIRSYIFQRQDGSAPELKGETVCTPSSANAMRRARKRREAGLIPLSLSK